MTLENFIELIGYACSALRLSHTDIQTEYSDYPICIINYVEKGINDKNIEIRFDGHSASLSALFNDKDICDFVILHPDEIENIDQILSYLSENYKYDFLKSCWIISNYKIGLDEMEGGIVFKFC